LLQPIGVSRIEIGSGGIKLDSARPHKDQLGTYIRCPTLKIVRHTAGKPGKKHNQTHAQGDARNADERANRPLTNV
jgi:hypothetical protein